MTKATKAQLKILEHYGVLGMKWGVRRDQATLDRAAGRKQAKAEKKQAKETVKSDKKFMKKATNRSLRYKIYNQAARKFNAEAIDKINSKPKYSGNLLDPKNAKLYEEYKEEVSNTFLEYMNAEARSLVGQNSEGDELRFTWQETDQGLPMGYLERVKKGR